MNPIIPVLLAGGAGNRLWPLSRKSYPKQFSQLTGSNSLFQESALRLISSKKVSFETHVTLTNSEFRFIVSEQLNAVGIDPGPILIEPESKNTAPAILSASIFANNKINDATLLVAPSDHIIPNTKAFHNAIFAGLKEIQNGKIVTFGIKPTHPETGYGYLQLGKKNRNSTFNLIQFIEKPNKLKAQKMLHNGNYLWNAGIFLFRAKDLIYSFKKYAPNLFFAVNKALENSKMDLGFLRLDPNAWSSCEDVSIDYAIMEKVDNLSVVPFDESWSDLGDWNAVWKQMNPNKNGVSVSSNAYAVNCKNTLLRSESNQQVIVGLGLNEILAISMPDAVLIAHKDKAQDIKRVIKTLKKENVYQTENFLKDHRPWGWFERLTFNETFQIKKLYIKSGGILSLQSHHYRSEHWVVVEGKAKVTINKKIIMLTKGQSVDIPFKAIHRLENPNKKPLILIEVQMGSYLGEDDIIRYEDIYSRR